MAVARRYFFGWPFGGLPSPGAWVGAGSVPRTLISNEPAAWPSIIAVAVLQPPGSIDVSSLPVQRPPVKVSGSTYGAPPPHGTIESEALPVVPWTPCTNSRSLSGTARLWFVSSVPSVIGSPHWLV